MERKKEIVEKKEIAEKRKKYRRKQPKN